MKITPFQPQGGPRPKTAIPRQQLRELSDDSRLSKVLDSTFSLTAGGIETELSARADSGRNKGIWGTVLATSASALLAWQGGLDLSALSVCASVVGLAGFGLGATGLTQHLAAKSDLKALDKGTTEVEQRSLQTVDGKVEDRRFMVAEALKSAVEVSDAATGQVIERRLQADNLSVREDVASGQVTLTADGKSLSFPGSIEMPTSRTRAASINHTLGAPLGELDATVLELGIEGDNWMRITGPTKWDSDGISYDPGFAFAGSSDCDPPGPQNTVRTKFENGTFTFQSPLDLAAFASGQLKIADSLQMNPMQATLETPPPPPPTPMKLGEYVEIQGQANKMLQIRADAASRYLETEARYANMQTSASALDPHRAEIKELQQSWRLLAPRPEANLIAAPSSASERRQLTSLQLDLLHLRGQAQSVREQSDRVRKDGLYQAKGPKEAATTLLADVKGELSRVESLLKDAPSA